MRTPQAVTNFRLGCYNSPSYIGKNCDIEQLFQQNTDYELHITWKQKQV